MLLSSLLTVYLIFPDFEPHLVNSVLVAVVIDVILGYEKSAQRYIFLVAGAL